jgi:hypothetical protein
MTPRTGDQPVARQLPTQDNTNAEIYADLYASSGIRNHDIFVQAEEDVWCLSPRGQYDPPVRSLYIK